MPKKIGRPPKSKGDRNEKGRILEAAAAIVREEGAASVTIRNVCRKADVGTGTFYYYYPTKDDLLMSLLRDKSFDAIELAAPVELIQDRIIELYRHFLQWYEGLGPSFVKAFFQVDNKGLCTVMGSFAETFAAGSVMARAELEIRSAISAGVLWAETDAHECSADIAIIVKGCIFDWCLSDGQVDMYKVVSRIISAYMMPYRAM